MQDKYQTTVYKYVRKLREMALIETQRSNVDKVCAILHALALLQYKWNQEYKDDVAEECIRKIATKVGRRAEYKKNKSVVLFYDGFGYDTRGLALIYVKALCDLGYNVIYIVPESCLGKQQTIKRLTKNSSITFESIATESVAKINGLVALFYKYAPEFAFFYTWPDDVEGCIAFSCMKNKVLRYQINLTDHAFWLGIRSFDYCIEFREYGACVSNTYRGISSDKILLLPYYPYIDKSDLDEIPDIDIDNGKMIFSGGSLYKTFDKDRTYYRMIEVILRDNRDITFLYAGEGDKSELNKLKDKYPNRVQFISEVKDLYSLMRRCIVYLNTYPMIGGLMTQYAAIAGKVPLTLVNCFENSLDGLLTNDRGLNLEFSTPGDLVNEINRLLDDDEYREQCESNVKECVMTESKFISSLEGLVRNNRTGFSVKYRKIDTSDFRKQYKDRFSNNILATQIINRKTFIIWTRFPVLLIRRVILEIKKLL